MQGYLCFLVATSVLFGSGETKDDIDCGRYNKTQLPFCECQNHETYKTYDKITCGLEKKIEISYSNDIHLLKINCKQVDTLKQCAELMPQIYFKEKSGIQYVSFVKPRISTEDLTLSMFMNQLNIINSTVPERNSSYEFNRIEGLILNGEGPYYTWAVTYKRTNIFLIEWFHSNDTTLAILNKYSKKFIEYLEINKMTSIPDEALSEYSSLKQLILSNNENLQLTPTFLMPLKNLETLKLFDNFITNDITSDAFNASNNLATVILMNNTFKAIPDYLFEHTKMLEVVKVTHNTITNAKLPKMFLANLPELITVDLSYSSLGEMSSDIFKNSTQIENIKLNNNKLRNLSSDVFNDLVMLVELDLSCNEITSLPESIFGNLSSLEVLNLNNNLIAVIKSNDFKSLAKLKSLLMSQNKLTAFCHDGSLSLSDLKTIDLSHNQLDFLSGSPFKELEALVNVNVSHNNISHFNISWSNSTELRSLDISFNKIQSIEFNHIHSDAFIMSKDVLIDLRNNSISSVDNFAYHQLDPSKGFSDRRLVLLANNSIICDCEVYDFVNYLKGRRGNLIAEDVQCAGPEDKSKKQLLDLNEEELTCSLNKESWCPGGCKCHFRPYDSSIVVHCEGGFVKLEKIHTSRKVESVDIESFEIHLENNSLTKLPILDNYVTKLYLNGNRFTDLAVAAIPENITVLDIRGNLLEQLTKETLEGILNKSQLRRIFISDNPLKCDCLNLEFISIIQRHQVKIADYATVKCKDGRKISELAMVKLCGVPSSHKASATVAWIFFVISVAVAAIISYKYRQITRRRTSEEYSLVYNASN